MYTHHNQSGTGKGQHLGYWTTSRVNDPFHLPWPGDFVDPDWDPAERDAVADYLDAQPDVEHWRGFSFCRLGCTGYKEMGTTDKSDGVFTWPEGLSHYVRRHNVKPPQEFIDHALGRVRLTHKPDPSNLDGLPHIYPLPDWVVVGATAKVCMKHGTLALGTIVKVHSFADDSVNIEVGEGEYFHYCRGDFAGLFEQASPTMQVAFEAIRAAAQRSLG